MTFSLWPTKSNFGVSDSSNPFSDTHTVNSENTAVSLEEIPRLSTVTERLNGYRRSDAPNHSDRILEDINNGKFVYATQTSCHLILIDTNHLLLVKYAPFVMTRSSQELQCGIVESVIMSFTSCVPASGHIGSVDQVSARMYSTGSARIALQNWRNCPR